MEFPIYFWRFDLGFNLLNLLRRATLLAASTPLLLTTVTRYVEPSPDTLVHSLVAACVYEKVSSEDRSRKRSTFALNAGTEYTLWCAQRKRTHGTAKLFPGRSVICGAFLVVLRTAFAFHKVAVQRPLL